MVINKTTFETHQIIKPIRILIDPVFMNAKIMLYILKASKDINVTIIITVGIIIGSIDILKSMPPIIPIESLELKWYIREN